MHLIAPQTRLCELWLELICAMQIQNFTTSVRLRHPAVRDTAYSALKGVGSLYARVTGYNPFTSDGLQNWRAACREAPSVVQNFQTSCSKCGCLPMADWMTYVDDDWFDAEGESRSLVSSWCDGLAEPTMVCSSSTAPTRFVGDILRA